MWSRFNLFQLSRDRWLWHNFYKPPRILLLASSINFFHGLQNRDFQCVLLPPLHRPFPWHLSARVHLQTSTWYLAVTQKMTHCQPRCHIDRPWCTLNRDRKWQEHELGPNSLLTFLAAWKANLSLVLGPQEWDRTKQFEADFSDSETRLDHWGKAQGEMGVCWAWPELFLAFDVSDHEKGILASSKGSVKPFNSNKRMFQLLSFQTTSVIDY